MVKSTACNGGPFSRSTVVAIYESNLNYECALLYGSSVGKCPLIYSRVVTVSLYTNMAQQLKKPITTK